MPARDKAHKPLRIWPRNSCALLGCQTPPSDVLDAGPLQRKALHLPLHLPASKSRIKSQQAITQLSLQSEDDTNDPREIDVRCFSPSS